MEKHRLTFLLLTAVLVLSSIWVGCSLVGDNKPSAPIVLGKSVDGVEFGDSEEEVIAKLGEPDGKMILDLAGGRRFSYFSPDDSLELAFTVSGDPAIGLGVISIWAHPAFEGKTEHGLGIGSPRSEVIDVLGQPDTSREAYDTYKIEGTQVSFEYRKEVVRIVKMHI